MKPTTHLAVLAVLLGITQISHSQTYTIGTDVGMNSGVNYPSPFGDFNSSMRAQYLYLASELTAAGMTGGFIDRISWNVGSFAGVIDGTEDYTIKMLQTETNSLGTTTWEEGAITVWGPTYYTPFVGENSFNLSTPFLWDGTSNIVVEICGGNISGFVSKNARVSWSGPLAFNGSHTRVSNIEPAPCDYTGTEYWDNSPGGPDYRPVITMRRIDALDCSDLATIGATMASETSVCESTPLTISVNPVVEVGITYAWFISLNGTSWSALPGVSTYTFTTYQTEPTYYRCVISCAYSGDNASSTPVFVDQNGMVDCFCQPSYLTGTTEGDYISAVNLGEISNTSAGAPAPFYTYYSEDTAQLTIGISNSLSVTVGTFANNNNIAAWIDYNQDGTFDPVTEKLGEVINLVTFGTGIINFEAPETALIGATKMRIRECFDVIGINPCDTYSYGETEDYPIVINPGTSPTAAFSYVGDPTITFTNETTGAPISYSWNFGDGGISYEINPAHTYSTNGTYNVCLSASNIFGTNTYCQNVIIDSYLPPVANFAYTGDPLVTFTDISTNSPTSWEWDFGDGGTSTLHHPSHTFAANGIYNVCLIATNVTGSDNDCKSIIIDSYPVPISNFYFTGEPTVTFTDASLNDPTSWLWNFGDGYTSTLENPTHTYTYNGSFNACLTATNVSGSNTSCQTIFIDSYVTPSSNFSYSGDPNVMFSDLSSNFPTSWFWEFGDGSLSTLENPTHTYSENGIFEACLTASNVAGSNTHCENIEISSYVYEPVADFNYSGDPNVLFTDMSLNFPASWEWDFGDGITSAIENPTHLFSSNGTYLVCLSVSNIAGTDEICKSIIIDTYAPPTAMFDHSGDPDVNFTDMSSGSPTSWLWNFGDGEVSTLANPTHTFSTNGIFNTCLTIVSPGGIDGYCEDITIAGIGTAADADFTYIIDAPVVYFSDNSLNGPTDWLWEFGDGTISGLQNPIHTFAEEGMYETCLTATNTFGSTTECKMVNVVKNSVQGVEGLLLKCYPNPAENYIFVKGLPEQHTNALIYLNSENGQEINISDMVEWNINSCGINMSMLAPGAYTVKIIIGKDLYSSNIIKL